jgi:hypothetical protein
VRYPLKFGVHRSSFEQLCVRSLQYLKDVEERSMKNLFAFLFSIGIIVFANCASATPITFEVDVTGALLPLGSLNNPPPPVGSGMGAIAGNQDALGQWTPNSIWWKDDGTGADVSAGDNIWTGQFDFLPGTTLQYKYTIGTSANEGSWSGTEEFALTYRGFTVPSDEGISI